MRVDTYLGHICPIYVAEQVMAAAGSEVPEELVGVEPRGRGIDAIVTSHLESWEGPHDLITHVFGPGEGETPAEKVTSGPAGRAPAQSPEASPGQRLQGRALTRSIVSRSRVAGSKAICRSSVRVSSPAWE